jgi:hypothetical protein
MSQLTIKATTIDMSHDLPRPCSNSDRHPYARTRRAPADAADGATVFDQPALADGMVGGQTKQPRRSGVAGHVRTKCRGFGRPQSAPSRAGAVASGALFGSPTAASAGNEPVDSGSLLSGF